MTKVLFVNEGNPPAVSWLSYTIYAPTSTMLPTVWQLLLFHAGTMVAGEAKEGNCPCPLQAAVLWLAYTRQALFDTTAIVVPTVRQLSLSLVGTMVAMEAREGNCPCPCDLKVQSKATFVHERNPRCFVIGAHKTSTRCHKRNNGNDSRAREGNYPCPWQVQRWTGG